MYLQVEGWRSWCIVLGVCAREREWVCLCVGVLGSVRCSKMYVCTEGVSGAVKCMRVQGECWVQFNVCVYRGSVRYRASALPDSQRFDVCSSGRYGCIRQQWCACSHVFTATGQ